MSLLAAIGAWAVDIHFACSVRLKRILNVLFVEAIL